MGEQLAELAKLRAFVYWLDLRAAADNRYVRPRVVQEIVDGFSDEEMDRILFSGEGPDDWS